jgi:hypothetical protein
VTSNEQVYRDALVAIRDRLQLRRKSHEDTQRDNDYAYQNANEALFATGAGFARVSDETAGQPTREQIWAHAKAQREAPDELELTRAKLKRCQEWARVADHHPNCAHWKPWSSKGCTCGLLDALAGSPEETTAPPRVPPRSFDIEGHMELYPSDEVSAPEKACDHYWHTDGYCVKCEMPQQKASECRHCGPAEIAAGKCDCIREKYNR